MVDANLMPSAEEKEDVKTICVKEMTNVQLELLKKVVWMKRVKENLDLEGVNSTMSAKETESAISSSDAKERVVVD